MDGEIAVVALQEESGVGIVAGGNIAGGCDAHGHELTVLVGVIADLAHDGVVAGLRGLLAGGKLVDPGLEGQEPFLHGRGGRGLGCCGGGKRDCRGGQDEQGDEKSHGGAVGVRDRDWVAVGDFH